MGGVHASGGAVQAGGASGDSNPGGSAGADGGADGGAGASGATNTDSGGTSGVSGTTSAGGEGGSGDAGGAGGESAATGWGWAVQSDDRSDSSILITGTSTQPSGAASFVVGSFRGSPAFGTSRLESAGNDDVFVAKYAADGSVLWSARAGGTGNDVATSVSALSDGGVFVAGTFQGSATFGGTTLNADYFKSYFLAKYTASGALAWAIRVGDVDIDSSRPFVAALADGSAYVTGAFGQSMFDDVELAYAGALDTFVAKYTSAGVLAWAVSTGGPGYEEPRGIAALADGSAFIAGTFTDTANFGATALTSLGGPDSFVLKLAGNGSVSWAAGWGSSDWEEPTAVAASPDGSVYVTSKLTYDSSAPGLLRRYTPSGSLAWSTAAGLSPRVAATDDGSATVAGSFSGTLSLPGATLTSSSAEAYIARFASNGSVLWAAQFEHSGMLFADPIFVSGGSAGDTHVAGYFAGPIEIDGSSLVPAGGYDTLLTRFDSDGTLEWGRQGGFVTQASVEANSVAALADGTSYVVGSFAVRAQFPNSELTTAGGSDAFIAKYRANGSLVWAKRIGGTGDDFAKGVAALPDGSFFVTGSFSATANFGGRTVENVSGSARTFLAKYDPGGTPLWVASSSGNDAGESVSVLADGSAYVAGHYWTSARFGNYSLNNSGSALGAFVAKFDAAGNVAWLSGPRSLSSGAGARARSVSVLADGTAYVTGAYAGETSFGSTTLSGLTNANVFLAKYTSTGALVWAVSAGYTNGEHHGTSVSTLPDGTAYVAGDFDVEVVFKGASGALIYVLANGGGTDAFIAKYAADGTAVWAQAAGHSSSFGVPAVSALPDGGAYFVGTEDAALKKYASGGTIAFTTRGAGTGGTCRALATTADSAFVTGVLRGTATFGETSLASAPEFEALVARYVP
jgi:hypothetical protein